MQSDNPPPDAAQYEARAREIDPIAWSDPLDDPRYMRRRNMSLWEAKVEVEIEAREKLLPSLGDEA